MRVNYDLIYAEVDLRISTDISRLGSSLSLSSRGLLEADNPRVAKRLAVERIQDGSRCSYESCPAGLEPFQIVAKNTCIMTV